MLSKEEWCLQNAPEALANESPEYIVEVMSEAYENYEKSMIVDKHGLEYFEHDGKDYSYDPNFWELVELYEPDEDTGCTHTLHYIGPVEDGRITCCIPKFPIYIHTFKGVKDLVHLPKDLPHSNCFDMFVDCPKLNPDLDEILEYNDCMFSGMRSIRMFGCSNSPYIVDAFDYCQSGYEIIAQIFDLTEMEVRKRIKDAGLESKYDVLLSETTPTNWFLNQLTSSMFLELTDILDDYKVQYKILSTGSVIVFDEVSRSSEMKYTSSYATSKHALASKWSPTRLERGTTYCYRLNNGFVVDSDDKVLTKTFGRVLDNVNMETSYYVGKNGTVTVHGVSSIVCEECPIQASGTLTIQGDGILSLETKETHACIGKSTHLGMSFGRWQPGYGDNLNTIVIDGVSVSCKSPVDNFSLGSYGEANVPEVICKNGGQLICPEMYGRRVMTESGAEGLCGSTKRVNPAKYSIVQGEAFT